MQKLIELSTTEKTHFISDFGNAFARSVSQNGGHATTEAIIQSLDEQGLTIAYKKDVTSPRMQASRRTV